MKLRYWGVCILVLMVFVLSALAFPAASGQAQGGILPTPTPFPVDNLEYDVTTVGGSPETLTYDHPDQDGFVLGQTTVTSEYPRGMVFTLAPTSPNGEITEITLFLRYVHGSGTRVQAEWDEAAGQWIAHPWATGEGQPAWTHFDFTWRVRDETGAAVDTEPIAADYSDPTREWFRMESPEIIVYWTGFSTSNPDWFGSTAAEAVAATTPRKIAGFGEPISYKSIAVIYGSREMMNEMYGSGISDETAGGFTSSDLGISVQYAPYASDDASNIEWLSHVITHELTHLYQYDLMGGNQGPNWWVEGSADWFAIRPYQYDARLMNLATMQDIPSLTEQVTRNMVQADGRPYLVYDMGASFINWLNMNYGGIDTIRQIIAQMQAGVDVYEAIEQATGKLFIDLQNEWRIYLGYEPLDLADIDPAAALQPAVDPLFEVGDTVTLPPSPPLPGIYENPGPDELYTGQCFANTAVEILQVGSLDGVDYYQVDCMGQIGWMTRDQLVGE
ncbi:MAG TPA: hypothetical protein VHP83_15660 [Aggregatilineaceae bacterium]|nr:hypothetical protein [Aggregatilineaceae bacterium]